MTSIGASTDDEGTSRRVLVTGADGTIGRVVRARLSESYELSCLTRRPAAFASHVGDIADLKSIRPAFVGIDTVLHLAAASSVDARWDHVLTDNIMGTYNVFEAAREAGARRVVFASSNHVVGMYEIDAAPALYDLEDRRVFGTEIPVRPDSLYGVSKVFGEALGRLYADRYGMDVICLRIGTVRADDDPSRLAVRPDHAYPPMADDERRRRQQATWLSHRDCAQLVRCALDAQVRWAVVYGVSANPRVFWELREARDRLGFVPQDKAPG